MMSFKPTGAHVRGSSSSSTNLLTARSTQASRCHRFGPKHVRQLASCARARPRTNRQRQMNISARNPDNTMLWDKIYWSHTRHHASYWSWRAQSSWHVPSCKWVRSERDPRQTPRDKDCPACQEESSRPTELSHRELIWQRQMQFMKDFMEKDPYEALFGRSNDRLRGVLSKVFWHESLHHPWPMKPWDIRQISSNESDRKTRDPSLWGLRRKERENSGEASKGKPKNTVPERTRSAINEGENKEQVRSSPDQAQPIWLGYGRWKVTSTDNSGKSFEKSGEMIYDPITMRMIPSAAEHKIDSPAEAGKLMPKKEAPSISIDDPGAVDHGVTQGNAVSDSKQPLASQSQHNESVISSGSVSSPRDTRLQVSAAEQIESSKSANGHKPSTLSLGMIIREQRLCLQVIRQVEKELRIARAGLKELVALQPSNPKQNYLTEVVEVARSNLRECETAVQKITAQLGIPAEDAKPASNIAVSALPRSTPPLPRKEALEKSWLRENGFMGRNQQLMEEPFPPITTNEFLSPTATNPVSNSNEASSNGAHFRQLPQLEPVDSIVQQSYKLMGERNRALKHMNASDLGQHRATLLKAWATKHEPIQKAETVADKKLNEEIKLHKAAMAAFENKWQRTKEDIKVEPTFRINEKSHVKEHSNIGVVAGKEDMSSKAAIVPNVYNSLNREPIASTEEQRILQDQELVSSIKEIYESYYGVIDKNHRQGTVSNENLKVDQKENLEAMDGKAGTRGSKQPFETSQSAAPQPSSEKQATQKNHQPSSNQLYRILAYDPSTQSIHTAIASSSFSPPTGERILSIPDALPRLHHPAKFLPHFLKLQADGYEIVSANKNLLVFKRIHVSSALHSKPADLNIKFFASRESKDCSEVKNSKPSEPADLADDKKIISRQAPLPATSIGNFASPTGFVNHALYEGPPSSRSSSSTSPKPSSIPSRENPRVRKEEAVFTGRRGKPFSRQGTTPPPRSSPDKGSGAGDHEKGKPSESKDRSRAGRAVFAFGGLLGMLYLLGWWFEKLEGPMPESITPDRAKPGFWAAVDRERIRRGKTAELEAERQEKLHAEMARNASKDESSRKLVALASAGLDVAIFGALLWAFIKFLESSGR